MNLGKKTLVVLGVAFAVSWVLFRLVPSRSEGLPPSESLAGEVSEERQGFIDVMDETCASTYNLMFSELNQLTEETGAGPGDLAYEELALEGVERQLEAFRGLGLPPDGVELFEKWLENVEQRVKLRRRYLTQMARGERFNASGWEMNELKREANLIGRRFGSTICTSNGPGSGNE